MRGLVPAVKNDVEEHRKGLRVETPNGPTSQNGFRKGGDHSCGSDLPEGNEGRPDGDAIHPGRGRGVKDPGSPAPHEDALFEISLFLLCLFLLGLFRRM